MPILRPEQIRLMRLGLPTTPANDSGGGNSNPNTTATTYTNNLPEYARPYFERLMDRTEGASNENYIPYDGKRVEGFNAQQNEAFNRIGGMQAPGQIKDATNLTNTAAQGMLGTTGYQAGHIGSTYNPTASQLYNAPSAVSYGYNDKDFDSAAAAKYMNPYHQAVTDRAKSMAIRQDRMDELGRQSDATKAGAFGGSRQAVLENEAKNNLGLRLDTLQTQGDQAAYENAQKQFEADRGAQMQSANARLGASQTNVGNAMNYGKDYMQMQQSNEAQRQAAAQMQLQGQTANEQARAQAAGIQQKGYENAGMLGGQLANIGKTQQDLDLTRDKALLDSGTMQQNLNQKALDTSYADFVNQRDYNKNNLAFYSGIMRGVPVTANSDVVSRGPAPNTTGQMAGLGIAGIGAMSAMGGGA